MTFDWIALLVIIPLAAGVVTTLLRGRVMLQRTAGLLSLTATGGCAAWFVSMLSDGTPLLVSYMGRWAAPYGIAIVFDGLSGALILIAAVVAVAAYLSAFSLIPSRIERGWFHPLFHLLVLGVNFSFITGDLFNLFVAFEIMLMASYALMCLGGSRPQLAQAYKYVILNLVGSTMFVLAAGMVYGMLGTLNYADISRVVQELAAKGEVPAGFQALSICLLFVFCLKAAVFPLWFWLPDTYHTMPAPIGALFAALLSKVGVYAILRLYPMAFATPALAESGELSVLSVVLPALAGTTMVIAIFAACAAHDVRRIVAMVLISHVGYLVFGVSLMRPDAFAGVLHYMAQEMLLIAGLFIASGVIVEKAGTNDIRKLGGLAVRMPVLATVTFILLMSLVGVPPLSGFYGKALLVREGIDAGAWWLVGATLLTATLTLVAAARLWVTVFWLGGSTPVGVPEGASAGPTPVPAAAFAGLGVAAAASLMIGFAPEPTLGWSVRATGELDNPRRYIAVVLRPDPFPGPPEQQDDEGDGAVGIALTARETGVSEQ